MDKDPQNVFLLRNRVRSSLRNRPKEQKVYYIITSGKNFKENREKNQILLIQSCILLLLYNVAMVSGVPKGYTKFFLILDRALHSLNSWSK